jgi:Uma2 family endonuclease
MIFLRGIIVWLVFILAESLNGEVVSPGQSNRDRDYVRQRKQYAARGIPEYWLIDPEQQAIAILQLAEGSYSEAGSFTGSTQIKSPELERLGIQLQLTAEQIFDVVK